MVWPDCKCYTCFWNRLPLPNQDALDAYIKWRLWKKWDVDVSTNDSIKSVSSNEFKTDYLMSIPNIDSTYDKLKKK